MDATSRHAAVQYLAPQPMSFWSLKDDGETFTGCYGATIAFREELVCVMRRLGSHPLPPFGAVLLLLAATRDSWKEIRNDENAINEILEPPALRLDLASRMQFMLDAVSLSEGGAMSTSASKELEVELTDLFAECLAGLDRIHALPRERRHSSVAKAEIVALVCENTKNVHEQISSETIVEALEGRWHAAALDEWATKPSLDPSGSSNLDDASATSEATSMYWRMLEVLRCLRDGFANFDPNRLELRMETGLDQLPAPVALDLPPVVGIKTLLKSLEEDRELEGLARLVRALQAAVYLPRPVAEPVDLPVGGVSDISNRGSLDRLLISELAHDDLTLATRVAMNEALYYRREIPPRTPSHDRLILLDCGIRLWGIPRVFASAVGLALVANADRRAAPRVFRAERTSAVAVDFETKEGLKAHLSSLVTTAHPGAAIPSLMEQVGESSDGVEVVIVTSDDTLADPDFANAPALVDLPETYLITVSRSGQFRLYLMTKRSKKLIREATLSLDDLFAIDGQDSLAATPSLALWDASLDLDLPAIVRVRPFPLLLWHNVAYDRIWSVDDSGNVVDPEFVYTLSTDRRLLRWMAPDKGGLLVADDLPPGKVRWAASRSSADGIHRAVIGPLQKNGLVLIGVNERGELVQRDRLELVSARPKFVTAHQGTILVFSHRSVEGFSSTNGGSLGVKSINGHTVAWSSRFFSTMALGSRQWFAVAFDGSQLVFETLVASKQVLDKMLIAWDGDGIGPIGLLRDGGIHYFGGDSSTITLTERLNRIAHVIAVSRDGARVAVRQEYLNDDQKNVIIDVMNKKTNELSDGRNAVEAPSWRRITQRHYHRRFSGISTWANDSLALTNKNGEIFVMPVYGDDCWLLFNQEMKSIGSAISFNECPAPPNVGYVLRRATWPDGSAAWIDSRGLLHLRSSDPSIPEATIVLSLHKFSGWLSDGRCWGDPYYFVGEPTMTGRDFYEQVLKRFVSRLTC